MSSPSKELRAQLAELEATIEEALVLGVEIDLEILSDRESLAAKIQHFEKVVEPQLAVLEAKRLAIVAQTWQAHKDAMGASAEIAMKADESFARGHEFEADVTRSFADGIRRLAQSETRKIVEGECEATR